MYGFADIVACIGNDPRQRCRNPWGYSTGDSSPRSPRSNKNEQAWMVSLDSLCRLNLAALIWIGAHTWGLPSFDLPVRQAPGPDPSTHRPFRQAQGPEALEGQAQGGEEVRTTMLRVMVRYSNHEALEAEAPLGLSSGRRLDRWYGVKMQRFGDAMAVAIVDFRQKTFLCSSRGFFLSWIRRNPSSNTRGGFKKFLSAF